MNLARKLVAIFYADVAGYSRLTGIDEEGTHRRVMAVLDEATAAIGRAGGTVLRYAGDAILAAFPSVTLAVETAVAIQEAIAAGNAGVADAERVELRIGINLGDVIEDRGEVYGEGVNLAARLEAAARPGGICVSATVHEQVRRRIAQPFSDGGEQRFKNIDEPVHVFHWSPGATATARSAARTAPAPAVRPAIAVLPFTNLSGDREQEYFSDGLTEDIIGALSQWRSIPVIARNSTFSFKGRAMRVQEVAAELGARYIVEGSVRRAGTRLRISVQLVDAESGHHVWSAKFDREFEDVFDVQDEITNRIAATVVPELELFEHRRASLKRTEDLNAWDLYLRGMETFHEDTCAGVTTALPMFRAAVEADPDYVDAWARIGWCHAKEVMFACNDDPRSSLRLGFEAARRAVALDNASAPAHMALGTVHIWAEETELGLAEAMRALELNPNFAHAAMAVGNRLDLVGRGEEGIAQMERALELNPRDPNRWRYMAYLARAWLSLGDPESAAEWSRQAIMLRPDRPEALFRHAVCVAHLDRVDEARTILARCAAIDAGYIASKSDWRPYPDASRNEHVLAGLRRHGLLDQDPRYRGR